MKGMSFIPVAAMMLGLAGCATHPVVLAPVGPNPAASASKLADGQLQVYSSLERIDEGDNLCWYQHTDYDIYKHGRRIKHVDNSVGHYEGKPALVTLAPGNYTVQAEGRESLRIRVPVEIKSGRITRIHLDARWKLPADTPRNELVSMPSGHPVGWRATQ